jgi:hypothetical protein
MVAGNADYIASDYFLSVYFHEFNILVLIFLKLKEKHVKYNINVLISYVTTQYVVLL